MKDHKEMGRFSVEFAVANYGEVVRLPRDKRVLENIKHILVSGVVDSGAAARVAAARGRSTWTAKGWGNQRPLR